ncbi:MAG: hypothetical protein K6F88_00335 [Ruminococcus sp.]|nr:hypothetical protein [Ruminococcus sp.]
MTKYKPTAPFNVPLMLLIPEYTKKLGVETKAFPTNKGILFYGSFRTFGGTERDVNGVFSIENTAVVDTWYRPEIKSDCRVMVLQSGAVYEILGEPENINMQNQYLKFKVKAIKGGA